MALFGFGRKAGIQDLREKLAAAHLTHGTVRTLGTPRRLAVLISAIRRITTARACESRPRDSALRLICAIESIACCFSRLFSDLDSEIRIQIQYAFYPHIA